jgi:hypothetical protein
MYLPELLRKGGVPCFRHSSAARPGPGSLNLIKEYRNYLWIIDRDGKVTNEPDHEFSHGMDALR